MEARPGIDFGIGRTSIQERVTPNGAASAAHRNGAANGGDPRPEPGRPADRSSSTQLTGRGASVGVVATGEQAAGGLSSGVELEVAVPSGTAAELIARAQLICGEANVLSDPAVVKTYRRDGTGSPAAAPLVVVLPASASEVAGLVSACAALSIGWTARGAATSTDGSALPRAGCALIVLTRMRRILKPLDTDGEITVEPGVSVEMLHNICASTVLTDASPSATVGGHAASVRGLRQLSAIELVTPDGSLAQSGRHQPGYDLAGAFCGSRGLAGIAVALTLQTRGSP